MTRRRALGRGLDALLEPSTRAGVREVPISRLEPNREQPRRHFDEEALEELADSIRVQGVVQPLVVTESGEGEYTIIAGERRWRAAQRAGLDRVPVVVREVSSDREFLELALVENLQRADLGPIEEATAYERLATEFDLSQAEIARRVGRARSTVANTLRLLQLPPAVQELLQRGALTAGQARPLLALDGDEERLRLARRVAERDLSAREVERIVREETEGESVVEEKTPHRSRRASDPHTTAAAERLSRRLQTRVEIRRVDGEGTVRIHFHSEAELQRLFDLLMKGERG